MADNENTFLNANNIYEDVEGETGTSAGGPAGLIIITTLTDYVT